VTTILRLSRTVGAALCLVSVLWFLDWIGRGPLAAPPLGSLDDLARWFAHRDPAMAIFAVLRLGAIALAWYTAVSLVVATVVRVLRVDWLARFTDAITLPAFRHLATGLAGAGLVSTGALATAAPAVADPVDATQTEPDAEAARPTESLIAIDDPTLPTETLLALDDAPGRDDEATMTWLAPDKSRTPVPTATPRGPPDLWVIEPGEHLWAVAERHLADEWGRSPTDAETTAYWRRLVEHNRARLPNPNDPDFVMPGMALDLPPP
jgi:hypothetical protein